MKRFSVFYILLLIAFGSRAGGAGTDYASSEARSRYLRGRDLRRVEEYDAALAEFRAAIALDPDCIEAHREYQNVMMLFGEQEELVGSYGDAVRNAPRSAAARYLYGRVLDDPGWQQAEFDEAVRLAPGFFWGHFGRAMVSLRTGVTKRAMREIGAALEIDPASSEGRRARGIMLLLTGKREEALDIFLELLEEDGKYREAYRSALQACRLLGRDDTGGKLSARAAALFPRDMYVASARGYFLARAGKKREAIDAYERALSLGALAADSLQEMRLLYAEEGRHGDAVALWEDAFGAFLSSPRNSLAPRWRRIQSAASALKRGGSAGELADLLVAYAGMGWWREAAAMRPALGGEVIARRGVAEALAAADGGACLMEVCGEFERGLAEERESGKRVPFREAAGRLDGKIKNMCGRSLLPRCVLRHSAGLRWLGHGECGAPSLPAVLRGGNKELIFFENIFGGGTECRLAEVVFRAENAGGPRRFACREEVGYCPNAGPADDVGGLAYPPFDGYAVFLDSAKWNDLLEARKLRKRNPLADRWFIDSREDKKESARDVYYSRRLEERLFEKVCRSLPDAGGGGVNGRLEELFTNVAGEHEYQHLLDLRRHLPVWRHPLANLALACRSRFSPSRIEEYFEERAVLRSLAFGRSAPLALLAAHSTLDGERGPHKEASRRVLERIVDYVADNPGLFPEIDTAKNVLNQLYLPDGEKLRGIARKLYGKK